MSADLRTALTQVLSAYLGAPVSVSGLQRLAGGSSHETWAFDATVAAVDEGHPRCAASHSLILRREFCSGMLDTDVRSEFSLLTRLFQVGVPVPRPWLYAAEDSALGTPFMVIERVAGTDLRKDLARADCDQNVDLLAAAAIDVLARIHAVPTSELQLGEETGAGHQIEKWVAVVEAAKCEVEPLLATAITWLRHNLPPAAPSVLVHADFKANNLIISPAGDLTVLDWELAHLGDPVEDLAWTLLWRTRWDVVGGLLPPDRFLEAYAQLTGRHVPSETLRFWRVFGLMKLWAMFLQGMATDNIRPQLRLLGRATVWIQDQLATELLETR